MKINRFRISFNIFIDNHQNAILNTYPGLRHHGEHNCLGHCARSEMGHQQQRSQLRLYQDPARPTKSTSLLARAKHSALSGTRRRMMLSRASSGRTGSLSRTGASGPGEMMEIMTINGVMGTNGGLPSFGTRMDCAFFVHSVFRFSIYM